MSGEFVKGGEENMLATGDQLRAHIDELVIASDGEDMILNEFSVAMGKLLADRIEHGVVPMGYVMATQLLTYDCDITGVDGFTGEKMPRQVTNQPSMMYNLFRKASIDFARGAFGNDFADQVKEVYEATQQQAQG